MAWTLYGILQPGLSSSMRRTKRDLPLESRLLSRDNARTNPELIPRYPSQDISDTASLPPSVRRSHQPFFFQAGKTVLCDDNMVEELDAKQGSCLLELPGDRDVLRACFKGS